MTKAAHRSFDELKGEIARRHSEQSGRLRQIGEYVLAHPNEVALGTVSVLAQKIGVQPSAVVRFASSLGFSGFTEMQQVFRARLVNAATPSYRERIAVLRGLAGPPHAEGVSSILARFIGDEVSALEALFAAVPEPLLARGVDILAAADTIYVMAQGRSFTVAYYLDYALSRLDVRSRLFDGVGGLIHQRARVVSPKDALLAVSFKDYAPETIRVAEELSARGVPVVAITDTPLASITRVADVAFAIGEGSDRLFQSMAAPMCLAQTLVVALGHRLTEHSGAAA